MIMEDFTTPFLAMCLMYLIIFIIFIILAEIHNYKHK